MQLFSHCSGVSSHLFVFAFSKIAKKQTWMETPELQKKGRKFAKNLEGRIYQCIPIIAKQRRMEMGINSHFWAFSQNLLKNLDTFEWKPDKRERCKNMHKL